MKIFDRFRKKSAAPNKSLMKRQSDFAGRLAMMKAEAGALGLFYTMQRMGPAIRMVGWEIAGTPDACFKHEAADQRAVDRAQRGGSREK